MGRKSPGLRHLQEIQLQSTYSGTFVYSLLIIFYSLLIIIYFLLIIVYFFLIGVYSILIIFYS